MALHHLPIVGLCGGGGTLSPERAKLAHDIGATVARLGAHLLLSASFSVAEAAAEGFSAVSPRRGIVLGNIARDGLGGYDRACCAADGTPYSSRCVELAMFTAVKDLEMPRTEERSRVNVLTCDAVVALPGWVGTRLDIDMAAGRDARIGKRLPMILLAGPGEEFPQELRAMCRHAADAAAVQAQLCRGLSGLGFFLTMHEQAPAH